MTRKNWTREQLIVAFNLYCRIPFGRIHNRNPEIIKLADLLGRSPSALSWKLANFARFDPALKERNILGASNGGKLEQQVWEEFADDWDKLSYESEQSKASLLGLPIPMTEEEAFPESRTRDATVKIRVNQGFFRSAVLATYEGKCCVTGLAVSELLCASHIVPWSQDVKNRTNPRNGLCLNALHDRAFDRGLMTIDADYKVKLSPSLLAKNDIGVNAILLSSDGSLIALPKRFLPEPSFLEYHTKNIFIAG